MPKNHIIDTVLENHNDGFAHTNFRAALVELLPLFAIEYDEWKKHHPDATPEAVREFSKDWVDNHTKQIL